MRQGWLAAFAGLVLCISQTGATAGPAADRLAGILRLPEIMSVMRDEGLAHAAVLDQRMLNGRGGEHWQAEASRLYDPARMAGAVRAALADDLSPQQVAECVAFYDTARGRRILALETAARVAMSDPGVEETARARYDDLRGNGDARLAAIRRFVQINDLVARNVSGATTSNLEFYRGMIDGGTRGMDEQSIIATLRAQQDELRRDTEGWVYGFLLLAYSPLSEPDMAAYLEFSDSPAGQALNDALFRGFDAMFAEISFGLGRGVARAMAASDL